MNDLNRSRNLAVRLRAGCFFPGLMLGVLLAATGPAQTFTVLHSFTGGDGSEPVAGLTLLGNILYGTTYGSTVFALNMDGTMFTNLYRFTAAPYPGTNSDGSEPAGLIFSGNTLYGTAVIGGSSGNGTVFAVNADGTAFTNLHTFSPSSTNSLGFYTNSDGAGPQGALVLSGNTLYGTAGGGGSSGNGTVFAVNADGTGFTNLYSFTPVLSNTNSDGAGPRAGVVLFSNILYGTTSGGGSSGEGTVFAVKTDGTGFTNLHSFTLRTGSYLTNTDGALPLTGLILAGSTLYGTAARGGSSDEGTVFAVKTDGTGFTNLHSFTAVSCEACPNSDGAKPYAGLVLSGNTLYGTAVSGGSSGNGTVFAVNTDGTGFMTLHSFTALSVPVIGTNSDGAYPYARLVLLGNTMYGTAAQGGSSNLGTVFRITLPAPQLTIARSQPNVILSWPTNFAGFDYTGYTLQSTTNLASPVWSTNLPAPVAVNGQLTVTNPISGSQQFFRLSQ